MALERSSLPANSTTKVWRAGRSTALIVPKTNASARTIQGCTMWVETAVARSAAWTRKADCVISRSFRLSMESTITPAQRESRRTGRNCANPRNPSIRADEVRRCISQPWATLCIQVPIREMSWPVQ